MFPDLTKTVVGFFMDAVQGRFFKLCIIITLLGIYRFISGLMILTVFEGHRCVRIINGKLFFRLLSSIVLSLLWFLHTLTRSGTVLFVCLVCI